jgi:hypothetical protein
LAVLGGNTDLIQWLIRDRYCALRVKRKRKNKEGPILTSKGRSPLSMALNDQRLDIVHYLVAGNDMSLFEEKELSATTELANSTFANFTAMLKMVPEDYFEGRTIERTMIPKLPTSVTTDYRLPADSFSEQASSKGIEQKITTISDDDSSLDSFDRKGSF